MGRCRFMIKRLIAGLVATIAYSCPPALHAQFSDPRTYTVAPVGTNQLELDYAHARADASLDTQFEVIGAHLELNEGTVSYTRNFGMLGNLAWVRVNAPFASVTGYVAGTNTSRSISGAGDSSVQLTSLLIGGKALSAEQFATYSPGTTVGLSVTVRAPTGEYDPQRLFNLGSDRWSLMPEFAVSHPFGPGHRWVVDAYLNVYFFTAVPRYHRTEILSQEPLPGVEGHISYDFTPSLWASLDLRYAFCGATLVDGVNQNDSQENLIAGSEVSWSPSSNQSLVFLVSNALVYRNAPDETRIALKYIYQW